MNPSGIVSGPLREDGLGSLCAGANVRSRPSPETPLALYAAHWLAGLAGQVKPRTLACYSDTLRLHLLPALGARPVAAISRADCRALLTTQTQTGRSRNSVRIVLAVLHSLLQAAVEDGILAANPASGLGRRLLRECRPAARQDQIKALTRESFDRLVTTARTLGGRAEGLVLLLARTGCRIGEALALSWSDVDLEAGTLRIAQTLSAGRLETPKGGRGRTVPLADDLAAWLTSAWQERTVTDATKPRVLGLTEKQARRRFAEARDLAGLPAWVTPHTLRHTVASLLLSAGESPVAVQQLLGHASISLTVDTYGKWLPAVGRDLVSRLGGASSEAGGGSRTLDLLITNSHPTQDSTSAPPASPNSAIDGPLARRARQIQHRLRERRAA